MASPVERIGTFDVTVEKTWLGGWHYKAVDGCITLMGGPYPSKEAAKDGARGAIYATRMSATHVKR